VFRGYDAMKLMPPVSKKYDKDVVVILKEPPVMEVEAECDRQLLCSKIVSRINEQLENVVMGEPSMTTGLLESIADKQEDTTGGRRGTKTTRELETMSKAGKSNGFSEMDQTRAGGIKFGGMTINLDNINISTYVCDFGNVVVGSQRKKTFRFTNVGKIPVSFQFDKKVLNNAQITIEPDKAVKVLANQSVMFNVTYSTRKNNPYGPQCVPVPIEIKNGPTYTIKFTSRLTIPELSMSTELLDFGKVCVNTRKTVKIRLENKQEVPCEWKFCAKSPMPEVMMVGGGARADKEGDRFQVWPHSGLLLPG